MDIVRNLRARAAAELASLIILGVAALGIWAFAAIADETFEGESRFLDERLLLALRHAGDAANPVGPHWFELAVADVSALGGFAVLTLLVSAVAFYLVVSRRPGTAAMIVGAALSGAALSEGLKLGFARPRPDLASHLVEVESASFPSGHAMLSAVVFLTLGALLARAHESKSVKALLMGWAIALTLMVGASRVYLGVHWPTDVVAGWAMGSAWAALWWLAAEWLQRRGCKPGTRA